MADDRKRVCACLCICVHVDCAHMCVGVYVHLCICVHVDCAHICECVCFKGPLLLPSQFHTYPDLGSYKAQGTNKTVFWSDIDGTTIKVIFHVSLKCVICE